MPFETLIIEIIEYTDPYCTWCWGSEPILRRAKEVYGDQVAISYKMGGLVEDVDTFYDPMNQIGGSPERMAEQVAAHWSEASSKHGMPVDAELARAVIRGMVSTYPANIACKAAQLQRPELGDRFIRRMREAAAAEGQPIHKKDVQEALAEEVGIDTEKFRRAIEDGSAEEVFRKDLKEARSKGIRGFPTFVIRNSEGKEILMRGYREFEAFERALDMLTEGTLVKRQETVSKERIREFLGKYGKVATREVSEVFGIAPEQAEELLETLHFDGAVIKVIAGNGYFWVSRSSR